MRPVELDVYRQICPQCANAIRESRGNRDGSDDGGLAGAVTMLAFDAYALFVRVRDRARRDGAVFFAHRS